MQLEPTNFHSKAAFVTWLQESASQCASQRIDDPTVFVGYDALSWQLWAAVGPRTAAPKWAFRSCPLPQTKAAAKVIWDDSHEEHLCLFLQCDLYVDCLLVAVRNGVWQSIDERFLPRSKSAFREISHDAAERLVGDARVWSAIRGEAQLCGFSSRVLRQKSGTAPE